MSEEFFQRDLIKNPEKIGKWDFYNIGATSVKNLKEFGLIRNVDYGEEERKKVDGLIVHNKNVIAIVEYKKPSVFKTDLQKNKAIKQELKVARKLGAPIIIATDTKETVWVNVFTGNKIKDENGNFIKENFRTNPDLIEKIKNSINESCDQIQPKDSLNPKNLAKQIWQDIWSVSGATPENCLYTFVELFIFKYLSDLGVLQGMFNFNTLVDNYKFNTENEILETYANIIRPKIIELFPENSLDKTTIINSTIFVSKDKKAVLSYSTVFKKVLYRFKNYGKLEQIDYDFKSLLFESFLKESISKKNWGQFFTPLKVVRAIVVMAKDSLKVGAKICDPACGVGKFLLESVVNKLDQFYFIKKEKLIPKITIQGYDKGLDEDAQKTIVLAKANMLIYFSSLLKDNPTLTSEFSKLFNESFVLKKNSILGTLSEPVENAYDLIVTNPPYVTSGSSNLKNEIKKDGKLINHYKINAIGVEGLFMEWIVKALKPNGKAFIIVPDGIFYRQNDKNLRQFLLDECYIDGIISLPKKTFFTTSKKTYILSLTKKHNNKAIQTDPVFTYLVSEIGESRDVWRFEIEQDDLKEAVILYSFFKAQPQNFAKINSDIRCKIQPITKLQSENHWCVERWWSKEQKQELGIESETHEVKIEDFYTLLDEISSRIIYTKDEVQKLATEFENPKFVKKRIKEIFDLKQTTNNNKFTKTFIDKNKGTIPVYSASKFQDNINYGYVKHNLKGIKYFENCLTWNIGGSIGKVHYRSGKFSITSNVIPLIVQNNLKHNFDLFYLKYAIEMEFRKHNFGFGNKPGKTKIQNIEISIPIDKNGNIDILQQKKIGSTFKKLEEIKKNISNELNKISSIEFEFD